MKTLAFEAATEHTTNIQYSNLTAIIIKEKYVYSPSRVVVVVAVVLSSSSSSSSLSSSSSYGLHEVYMRST